MSSFNSAGCIVGGSLTLVFSNLFLQDATPVAKNISLVSCSALCLKDGNCAGLFYHERHQTCYFSAKKIVFRETKLLSIQGIKFYEIKESCPSAHGYQLLDDGSICYRYGTGKTWYAADADCRADGGRLIQIKSSHDHTVMHEIAERHAGGRRVHIFFGLVDLASEPGPRWADGSPLVYQNWQPKEPNSVEEECGAYYRHSNVGSFLWYDINCNESADFVCQIL